MNNPNISKRANSYIFNLVTNNCN